DRPRQIGGAEGLVDEESPPGRADQPLDRYASAMRAKLVAALAVPHRVHGSTSIELRPPLSESQQRPVPQRKFEAARLGDDEALHNRAAAIGERNRQRT